MQGPSQICVASDLLLAFRATATGVTYKTAKNQDKYWAHWCSYCFECGLANPYLKDIPDIKKPLVINGFAARVRSGAYSLGDKVRVQTVSGALAAVSNTMELACKQSPLYQTLGEYILPVRRCIEGFRRDNPPSIPQLAVPVSVPEEAAQIGHASNDPFHKAVGDLSLVAFYFLLRSGEYTKPRRVRHNNAMVPATRTRQFRVKDVGFWKNGKQLSRYQPLSILLTADAASMRIDNQKNSRMGQVLYLEATGPTGGVAALARRIVHILKNNGTDDHLICDVHTKSKWQSVQSADMVRATRAAVTSLNLDKQGIDPNCSVLPQVGATRH